MLVRQSVLREVADLTVSVLDDTAGLCDEHHAPCTEISGLGIGRTLVVAMLFLGREGVYRGFDDIVFQFAHCPEVQSLAVAQRSDGLAQGILRCALQRIAVLVEKRTKHTKRGNLGKRINESGREARHHIQITARSLDKVEQRRAVNTFATTEDRAQIRLIGDHEVQRFQLSVSTGVHEVHHLYRLELDEFDDVLHREILRCFL